MANSEIIHFYVPTLRMLNPEDISFRIRTQTELQFHVIENITLVISNRSVKFI